MTEELLRWWSTTEVVRSIGMAVEEVGDGWARTTLDPPAALRNPNGAVNGGVLASFMDLAGGLVVGMTVGHEQPSATIELGIHYLRAAIATPLTATSRIVRRARNFMFMSIEAVDARGRPCVAATGTWAIGSGSFPPTAHARQRSSVDADSTHG